MLQIVCFNLWRIRSHRWANYNDYKYSIAAAFIMGRQAGKIGFRMVYSGNLGSNMLIEIQFTVYVCLIPYSVYPDIVWAVLPSLC